MANRPSTERCEIRTPAHLRLRIKLPNGAVAEGECVDSSEHGFGVISDASAKVGETVVLSVGSGADAPVFLATVMWRKGSRIGLRCIGVDAGASN
jgi:hypothetical protein